ncbi:hypothetical protein BTA51_22105 [Hahella sp. CCB-MM4]|uniref:MarC family protein n=1 Tax=Hahella sp. (strain CCB-MM4) TaxID=1926491 RepID=UPI000B9A22C5|nr:MarC family protein [Hahella sp. CCB-MM4]OZG71078.1 hypothetical protein BTA51_22105 [Hahella sp. CCB-MM4]
MVDLIRSSMLLFVLLNPFLLIIYLINIVQKLERGLFIRILIRAGLIATAVFWVFTAFGDAIFSDVFQTEFASFQIFGGVVFLIIGLQFVFRGPTAIEMLQGESEHLVGAIAMPILIGPGTISASIIIGKRHDAIPAAVMIFATVFISILIMIGLKSLHDYVRKKHETLIQRYIEIIGRIMALYVGTVAIDMIMQGTRTWIGKF